MERKVSAASLLPNRMLAWTFEMPDVGPLLKDATGMLSDSSRPLAIFNGVAASLPQPLPPSPPVEDVIWTNAVGVSVAGNSLTKTVAAGWGNAGASSNKSIAYGDGYMEFTASQVSVRMVGLSNGDSNQNYTEIDFAIYLYSDGLVYIREGGVSRGAFGAYAVGDKLRVAVEGGAVKYYRNTTLLYTSTLTPTYPLLVDSSLYGAGATVTDAVISGMLQGPVLPENVIWTNVVGATASGNDLTKTATTAWGNSGAVSTDTIPYGDGYVEFTASETNTSRMVGLGTGDASQSYTDINFAFYMYSTGILYVYENGTNRGAFSTYATGDRFRIAVEGGVVTYYQNGALVYTSTIVPVYPLLVDTALYTTGATITDVTLSWDPDSDPSGDNYSAARLDPLNRTGQPGVDMLSRNINWKLPILGLPGRAGLDLGLSLSYNSLVWTKSGSTIRFDADRGTPSPGFRLGFPTIQERYYNSQVNANAYLLITPSGSRVELRQVGATNVYESADSSYLELTDNGNGSLTLRPTDGSQLTYAFYDGQYQCTQVKDRNGNFITVSYYTDGRINWVKDTLARVITFNYDVNLNLISITQTWGGVAHTWATFGWSNLTIQTSFTGLTVLGPQNGTVIPVLTQVGYADGTRHNFDYTSWGQVWKIRRYADDDHLLFYSGYSLPGSQWLATSTQTDCPRPTQQRAWAENWNGQNGVPAETIINYAFTVGASGQATMPDATIYKEFFATTGWQKGLTTTTEVWSGGVKKKWTTIGWTQDNTALSYRKNPRVIETNIYDPDGNRKRTTIRYDKAGTDYERWGLPYLVTEYAADGVTEIRHNYTDYNLDPAYINRHIIGLVDAKHISNTLVWQSVVHFSYDAGGSQLVATPATTVQHDAAYGTGFLVGRANLTTITRYDATDLNNATKRSATQIGYDTNGSVVFTKDALNHQTNISYSDSFSDAVNRNTFAYPTKVTPPTTTGETAANFASTIQYDYDFGAVTRTQGPVPAGQTLGDIQTMQYDVAGRISRVDNLVNTAYTRWVYHPAGHVSTYTKVQTGAQETVSTTVFDGAGRVRGTSGDNPNSTGGYRGQFTYYDVMGRVLKQSNPAEMTSAWVPAGDDSAGWVWTQHTYDWKGRPLLTTNPDGTTKEATYGGCGCAGGEVATIRDEAGRRQRVTSDVLGRVSKTEILNWDQTVYSTIVNTYNSLDQLTNTKTYQGAQTSGVFQEITLTYDGHARLSTSKAPEQLSPTIVTYNADDTTNVVTDARGATTTYGYNVRHGVETITRSAPAGVTPTAQITFDYDAAGNRTQMTDGLGSTTYNYDRLSRLTSETRNFTGVGSFTLSYGYNLANELTSVTDPTGVQVNYAYDHTGRLTNVTGAGGGAATYASGLKYRAWGALKQMTYGNNLKLDLSYNNRRQTTLYDLKTQAGARVMGREYRYTTTTTGTDNDGRVKYSHDLVSDNMDRTYTYDHAGRLTSAKAGTPQSSPYGSYYSGPFEQGYIRDVWDNLVHRTWRTFGSYSGYTYPQQNGYSETYVNNKNTNSNWLYDSDGRLLKSVTGSTTLQYTYDAAGRVVASTEPGKTLTHSFDGDGQRIKLVENSTTTYHVRSSALDGQVITELDQWGQKRRGYVTVGGEVLAKQENGQVFYEHQDEIGNSNRTTDQNGVATSKVETDPLGTKVDDSATYNYSGSTSYNYNPLGFYGNSADPGSGCGGGGMSTPCMGPRRPLGYGIGIVRTDVWTQSSSYVNPSQVSGGGGWHYDDPRLVTTYTFVGNFFGGGSSGGGTTGGTTTPSVNPPQDTVRTLSRDEVSSQVDDILKLFKDNPDCEKWTNKLLEKMRKATGFDAGNIRDILEDFRKNGILLTDGKQSGDGSGSTGYGRGYLAVGFNKGGSAEATAVVLMHEIIHWAGQRPGKSADFYNDKAMAAAWSNLGVVMSVDKFRSSFPEYVKELTERDGYDYAESRLAGAANKITCLGARPPVRTLK